VRDDGRPCWRQRILGAGGYVMQSCATCRFFVNAECHRIPPDVIEGWPDVDKDEWCGEYRPTMLNNAGC